MERKTLSTATLVVKNADRGEVEAEIGTVGVVDRDGDVFLPRSTPTDGSKVKISGYSHDIVTGGAPPAGAGTVTEESGKILLRGRFFMGTTRGRESFEVVKELAADGQWSIGFPESSVKTAPLTKEWKERGARRLIAAYKPVEASPVFMGAQPGTRTLAVKQDSGGVDLAAAQSLVSLKAIMAEGELSHADVAGAMEVSVDALRAILRGEQPLPDLSTLKCVVEPIRITTDPEELERKYRTHRARFDVLHGPPDGVEVPRGVRTVAEHAAEWAAKQWGVKPPRIVFYTRAQYSDGASGYFRKSEPGVIHLRHDLDAGELFRVALHETCHYVRNRKGMENDEDAVDSDTRNLLNLYRQEATKAWAAKMASSAELLRY